MEIPPYVTLTRAAALLGVELVTVREWANSGKLAWCHIGQTKSGPVRKISRESLRACMVSRGAWVEEIDGEPDFLTMKDVARLTGRGTTTVFEWVRSGLLPSVETRQDRIPGGKRNKTYRKILRAAFDAFRREHARALEVPAGPVMKPKPPKPPRVEVKPPSMFTDRFISQYEAARILEVSQAAITNWVSKGLIRSEEIPTTHSHAKAKVVRRIRREDFQAFVESGVRPKMGRRKRTRIDPFADAA